MMDGFESARIKYKPDIVKYLLVAETPPRSDSNRFFYFENVMDHDSLFLETMKVLYPEDSSRMNAREIRSNKATFLLRFKNDGFYLIDSLEVPFERRYSSSQKVRLIGEAQESFLSRINSIKDENTKVILISGTVFEADFNFLKKHGINVINKESIPFPAFGHQEDFRNKMNEILVGHNNNSYAIPGSQ
jgi:hypothetical protein